MSFRTLPGKFKDYLFKPRYIFNQIQFDAFGVFFISVGLIGTLVFGIISPYLPKPKALAESIHSLGSGGNTELTAGAASNVSVTASAVTLSKDTNWFDLAWNYKRQLTLQNLSSSTLTSSTSVQISLDTSSLESIKTNCEDLRIVYQNSTVLATGYSLASGATNCTNSKATLVNFQLQADILTTASDSTNYALYYGNSSVSALSFPKEKVLTFDGTNDQTRIPDSNTLDITTSITISVWAKFSALNNNQTFVSKRSGSVGNYALRTGTGGQANQIEFYFYDGSAQIHTYRSTNANLSVDTWYHIAATYSTSGGVSLYRDGVLLTGSCATGTCNTTLVADTNPLRFGTVDSASQFLAGSIDEIRIWDRVLTQAEIQARMNKELDSTDTYWSNLRGYWRLDETSGQTITDSTSNANNGNLGVDTNVATDDPSRVNNVNAANSVGSKNATLACPFNETSTCLDSKSPTTSNGAIRYTGGKSAISLDGIDDIVTVADNNTLDISVPLTLEAWVYVRGYTAGASSTIIQKSSAYRIYIDTSNRIKFSANDGSGEISTTSSGVGGTVPLNTWTHVAAVYDGNNVSYYLNGILIISVPFTIIPQNSTSTLKVGATSGDNFLNGLIDEARVSNTLRYSSNFTPLTTPYIPDATTALLFHFDENGSDPRNTVKAVDASGNGNHGTLTNGPTYSSGLVGVDNGSSDTGKQPIQSYAGHQGVFLEQGTTNYIINPSFETDVTNWSCYNFTGCATSRITSDYKFGAASMRVTGSTNSGDLRHRGRQPLSDYGLIVGDSYCFSSYVKTVAGRVGLVIAYTDISSVLTASHSNTTATYGNWTRISVCSTVPASSANVDVKFTFPDTTTDVYIDGAQFEKKSAITTYADGTLGTGYVWTGTAHASSSTRTNGYFLYPSVNAFSAIKGSISLWVRPNWDGNDNQNHSFSQNFVDSSNLLQVEKTSSNTVRLNYKVGNVTKINVSASTAAWTKNSWYHIVAVWDTSAAVTGTSYGSIFVNNSRTNDAVSAAAFTGFTAATSMYVGNNSDTFNSDALISDYRVYDTALTATEVNSMFYSGLIAHSQASSSQAMYTNTGTWTSPIIDLVNSGAWGVVPNFVKTETLNGNSITYETRTSPDGSTWSSYQAVQGGTAIQSAPDRYLQIRTTLNSTNKSSTPTFTGAAIHYVQDTTAPASNASNIVMQKTSSGSVLALNDWTNDLSPYFTWTAGADNVNGSGLKGYCLYLGQDGNADPATTKGLLGTSPLSTTNTTCQFITASTSLDLGALLLRGNTWLTSSTLPYYLNIKAIDNTGNLFPTTTQFQFRYDSSLPTNPSALSAPQAFQRDLSSFTVTWPVTGVNIAADNYSGVKGYQYKLNNGKWQGNIHNLSEGCADYLDVNTGTYTLNPTFDSLLAGENTFYLRTLDTACNFSQQSLSVSLKFNSNAPSSPQNLQVNPTVSQTNLFSFSWSAPLTFSGSTLTYCYTVNVTPTAEGCSWTSAISLDADAYATQPGKNTFYVIAKDEAGNTNYDDYAEIDFTANTTAPGIARNIDIADISIKSSKLWKLALSWEEPEDKGAGIKNYKIYRAPLKELLCTDDLSKFTVAATTSGTSFVDVNLSQKDYSYCVKSCDSANNCSAVSSTVTKYPTGKFTTPAPVTVQPQSISLGTRTATIIWETERTSDSKIAYGVKTNTYNPSEAYNSPQLNSHEVTLTNLKPGTTYFYQAKWTDEDGNTGTSEEKTFTTLPAPKIIQSTVKNIFLHSAVVQFTSKGASKVKIYYGKTSSYGSVKEINTSTSESVYSLDLDELQDGTKYLYEIKPVDSELNEYDGTVMTFSTPPSPRVTGVRIQEIKTSAQPAVIVYWNSNSEVSSIISYTDGNNVLRQEVDSKYTSGEHKILLKGLSAISKYTMKITARDRLGNEVTSEGTQFTTATDNRAPKISNIKVESVIVNQNPTQATAQLIISWDTDELASAQVEYAEGSGSAYSQVTQGDASFTYNHIVVISNLSPSKVYHFRIISKDNSGNETKSLDTVTITPKSNPSALSLVLGNLSEIFKFFGDY